MSLDPDIEWCGVFVLRDALSFSSLLCSNQSWWKGCCCIVHHWWLTAVPFLLCHWLYRWCIVIVWWNKVGCMAAVTEICLSLSLSFHPQLFNKQALLCSIELGSIQCTNRNRHLHISKILFLLSVSFTIEYRVGIAELYLYMGLLVLICRKMTEPENCRNGNPHAS